MQTAQAPMWNAAMGGISEQPIAARLAAANSMLNIPPTTPPPIAAPSPSPMARALGAASPVAAAAPAAAPAAAGGMRGILAQVGQGVGGRGMGLRTAGVLGIGGQLAGGLAQGMWNDPESSADNALASGLRWAGTGAALGSLAGPWGAAIGGVGGGILGAFKGIADSRNEGSKAVASELTRQQAKIAELMTQLGSSPDLREDALAQLQMSVLAGDVTSKDQVRAIADGIRASLPQALQADREQQQQQRMMQANQAAVQAWMGPLLQQSVDKSQFYADQFAQAGLSAANEISDPALRLSQQQMARSYSAEQAAANAAYMQQIAASPGYWGYQNDLLQQLRQAQQQVQQQPDVMAMLGMAA